MIPADLAFDAKNPAGCMHTWLIEQMQLIALDGVAQLRCQQLLIACCSIHLGREECKLAASTFLRVIERIIRLTQSFRCILRRLAENGHSDRPADRGAARPELEG